MGHADVCLLQEGAFRQRFSCIRTASKLLRGAKRAAFDQLASYIATAFDQVASYNYSSSKSHLHMQHAAQAASCIGTVIEAYCDRQQVAFE